MPIESRNRSLRWYCVAAVLFLLAAPVILAAPALWLEKIVAVYARYESLPGDIRRLVSWSEVFAHGLGVAVIAVAIFVLDKARRPFVPRVLACAFGAGILANLGKALIARTRPNNFDLSNELSESFVGFFPAFTADPWNHSIQSFPSGHTATAVGFALGLSRLYPRATWLFAACAAMAGFQRIAAGAHFLSDVIAGAAVGFVAAGCMSDPRLAGRWFDRLETRWSNEPAESEVLPIDAPAPAENRRAG